MQRNVLLNMVSVCHKKLLSRTLLNTPPPNQRDHCLTCRQPIRVIVYPHILNRQRRAARQLLFVIDNAHAVVDSAHFQLRF
jgi:hypothetical protein